ncbi:MAG TPA: glycogen synthase GlgA [Acidiferrobacterales bacterium]
MKILYAASEALPLMKTGGLGDVAGSLPAALRRLGSDARLVMPGYRDALARAPSPRCVAELDLPAVRGRVRLLETRLPGDVPAWLVDFPPAYDRPGNPYLAPDGVAWRDNAERFALFAQAVAAIADGRARLDWRPALVHANDWQTGLVPALLSRQAARPATVFTIHNLAYQGLFPRPVFDRLGLPSEWWHPDALEFHGQLSLIKAGLAFADRLTTVSPGYAREIQTPAFGCGLDGLLRHRAGVLRGILNGIDTVDWDPARDPALARPFHAGDLAARRANKRALQDEFGLAPDDDVLLLGNIGRMVEQKGIDLTIAALPAILALPAQVAMLGTGEARFQQALRELARRFPGRLAVRIGYVEALAHRIEAGSDAFLMPSRFEPCGLNQLYSLRYGCVPIVHRVGGLADTVIDATPEALAAGIASGVAFDRPNAAALIAAVQRALALYRQPRVWEQTMRTGMAQDHSWEHSARDYLALYDEALAAAA